MGFADRIVTGRQDIKSFNPLSKHYSGTADLQDAWNRSADLGVGLYEGTIHSGYDLYSGLTEGDHTKAATSAGHLWGFRHLLKPTARAVRDIRIDVGPPGDGRLVLSVDPSRVGMTFGGLSPRRLPSGNDGRRSSKAFDTGQHLGVQKKTSTISNAPRGTADIPWFRMELWDDLPTGSIGARSRAEFEAATSGWFTKDRIMIGKRMSAAEHADQGWYWYNRAKTGSDELLLGDFAQVNRHLKKNPGAQRLDARPWSHDVNDAWILGGVERRARFRVVTNIELPGYRVNRMGKESVFSRELRLLTHHGYRFVPDPNVTGRLAGKVGWMVPGG